MVNCDYSNGACNGGWLSSSLNYLQNEGLVSEDCLPYKSSKGDTYYCTYQCADPKESYYKYACKYFSQKYLTTNAEIMNELEKNGPLMVGFAVYSDFMSYSSGVYQKSIIATIKGGHAVKLIGWNYDSSGLLYWICQNQWSTSWGESGFFNIYAGQVGIDAVAMTCDPDIS